MVSDTASSRVNSFRKWLGLVWVLIEVNIASANIFGFPALFEILPQYGIFDDYCHSIQGVNSTQRDCSGRTKQYQNALTLGIIAFNIPSIFVGLLIDTYGCRFVKLIGVVLHVIGWLSLALLRPGRDSLLFVHTCFIGLAGISTQITSFVSTNYFSKSREFLLALLVGTSAASSIWYSVFQIIVDNYGFSLSNLAYIWVSFAGLLFLSSFLFLDWKFPILNLPYKMNQDPDTTPSDTPAEAKWYMKIYQRTGLWEHLANPLYITNVLYLSILMVPTILLAVTWYPWVYFINNSDIGKTNNYTIAFNMSVLSQIIFCPIIGLLLSFQSRQGQKQKLLTMSLFQTLTWIFNITICIVCMFVKLGVVIPALIVWNFSRSSIIAGTQAIVGTFFPLKYIGTLTGVMWTITGAITCIQYGLVKLTDDLYEGWKAWVIVLALVLIMSCHWIYLWVLYAKEARKDIDHKSETA